HRSPRANARPNEENCAQKTSQNGGLAKAAQLIAEEEIPVSIKPLTIFEPCKTRSVIKIFRRKGKTSCIDWCRDKIFKFIGRKVRKRSSFMSQTTPFFKLLFNDWHCRNIAASMSRNGIGLNTFDLKPNVVFCQSGGLCIAIGSLEASFLVDLD